MIYGLLDSGECCVDKPRWRRSGNGSGVQRRGGPGLQQAGGSAVSPAPLLPGEEQGKVSNCFKDCNSDSTNALKSQLHSASLSPHTKPLQLASLLQTAGAMERQSIPVARVRMGSWCGTSLDPTPGLCFLQAVDLPRDAVAHLFILWLGTYSPLFTSKSIWGVEKSLTLPVP